MPNIVYNPSSYTMQFDAREFGTITRALAHLAGMNIKVKLEEQRFAASLNEKILQQRLRILETEKKAIEGALTKAEEHVDSINQHEALADSGGNR